MGGFHLVVAALLGVHIVSAQESIESAILSTAGVLEHVHVKECTHRKEQGPGWKIGDWSPCLEPCGTIQRTVECWDFTSEKTSDVQCKDPPPPSKGECPCDDTDHSKIAAVDWGCPDGWSTEDCECCPSLVVDIYGQCCHQEGHVKPTVDAKGQCCSAGYVDACGICGGHGVYLDRQGTCCKDFTVDGDGLCCDSEVDACGVCGGRDTTCGTVLELFTIINTTGIDSDIMDDMVRIEMEEMIATELNFPSVLLSVQSIAQFDLGTLDGGDAGDGRYGATLTGTYGAALTASGRYGEQVVATEIATGGGYGDRLGEDLQRAIDLDITGGPDSDAMLAARQVVVELLPLEALEEQASSCAPEFDVCHGDEDSERRPCCSPDLQCVVKNAFYGQCLPQDRIERLPEDWDGSIVSYNSSTELESRRPKELAPSEKPMVDMYQMIDHLNKVEMPRDMVVFFTAYASRMCGDGVCSPGEMPCGIPASFDHDHVEVDREILQDKSSVPLSKEMANIPMPFGAHGFPYVCMMPSPPSHVENSHPEDEPHLGKEAFRLHEDSWHHHDLEGYEEWHDRKLRLISTSDDVDEKLDTDENKDNLIAEARNPTFYPEETQGHTDELFLTDISQSCGYDCAPHFGCPVAPPIGHSDSHVHGHPYLMCAGNGFCNFDDGACQCYPGYTGLDCTACADGFFMTSHGRCQVLPKFDKCTPGSKPTEDPSPKDPEDPKTKDPVEQPRPPKADDSKVKLLPWSECNQKCGGGVQTREWGCYDGTGLYRVEDSLCEYQPRKEDLEQTCNKMPCETFTLKEGKYSECSATCGGGFQTAQHICLSSYGYAAPISKCQDVPPSYRQCNMQTCTQPYYTYSGWTPCSVTCGGGEKTRTATCNTPLGQETIDSECTSAQVELLAVSVSCNSRPCEAHGWEVTSWGECDAACGGQRMREVTCINIATNALVPTEEVSSKCTGKVPAMQQECEPCGFCEDERLNENCSGSGTCENGACTCDDPWGGSICSVDLSQCASAVEDRFGACCSTGVLNKYGQCCLQTGDARPSLDAAGLCCDAGYSDKCGVCGGTGIGYDVTGKCCEGSGIFDTQMFCCDSGNMDACGVCDGAGDQCGTRCLLTIDTPGRRRKLLQDATSLTTAFARELDVSEDDITINLSLDPADSTLTTVDMEISPLTSSTPGPDAVSSTGDVTVRLLEAQAAPDIPQIGDLSVSKTPVCGDTLCSPGEARVNGVPDTNQTCMEDCPLVLGSCPSPGGNDLGNSTLQCGGNGFCNVLTLTCECFDGYSGEACGWCATSTHRADTDLGSCVVKLSAVPALEDVPADNNSTSGTRPIVVKKSSSGDSKNRAGMIVGLTFMAVVVVAAAVGAGWAYKTGRIGGSRDQQYITEDHEAGPTAEGREQDLEVGAPASLPATDNF